MAKKTSYLTELIERHQRWKDEGGGKQEEHDNDVGSEMWVFQFQRCLSFHTPSLYQAGQW